MSNPALDELTREQLIELIELYSKDWLAHDGVWFQSVEAAHGMDEAMVHNTNAWKRFTVIEARRLKRFLDLEEHPGLEGLDRALQLRFYGNLNDHETVWTEEGSLVYRNIDCRVQTARLRKGMPLHPCKETAIFEYSLFASTIDDRIQTRCISCYPDCTEAETGCAWEFFIQE